MTCIYTHTTPSFPIQLTFVLSSRCVLSLPSATPSLILSSILLVSWIVRFLFDWSAYPRDMIDIVYLTLWWWQSWWQIVAQRCLVRGLFGLWYVSNRVFHRVLVNSRRDFFSIRHEDILVWATPMTWTLFSNWFFLIYPLPPDAHGNN